MNDRDPRRRRRPIQWLPVHSSAVQNKQLQEWTTPKAWIYITGFCKQKRHQEFSRGLSKKSAALPQCDQKKSTYQRIDKCFLKKAAAYSPTSYGSTIGADGLNFPVRYGKGWAPSPWPPGFFVVSLLSNVSWRSFFHLAKSNILT